MLISLPYSTQQANSNWQMLQSQHPLPASLYQQQESCGSGRLPLMLFLNQQMIPDNFLSKNNEVRRGVPIDKEQKKKSGNRRRKKKNGGGGQQNQTTTTPLLETLKQPSAKEQQPYSHRVFKSNVTKPSRKTF